MDITTTTRTKPVDSPISAETLTPGGVAQEAARVASISTVRPGEKTLADIIKGTPRSPLHESESKARVKAVKLAGVLAPVDRESKDAIRKAALDGDPSVRIAAWDEIDNFKD